MYVNGLSKSINEFSAVYLRLLKDPISCWASVRKKQTTSSIKIVQKRSLLSSSYFWFLVVLGGIGVGEERGSRRLHQLTQCTAFLSGPFTCNNRRWRMCTTPMLIWNSTRIFVTWKALKCKPSAKDDENVKQKLNSIPQMKYANTPVKWMALAIERDRKRTSC